MRGGKPMFLHRSFPPIATLENQIYYAQKSRIYKNFTYIVKY